jgi:hypothetical protein
MPTLLAALLHFSNAKAKQKNAKELPIQRQDNA